MYCDNEANPPSGEPFLSHNNDLLEAILTKNLNVKKIKAETSLKKMKRNLLITVVTYSIMSKSCNDQFKIYATLFSINVE